MYCLVNSWGHHVLSLPECLWGLGAMRRVLLRAFLPGSVEGPHVELAG